MNRLRLRTEITRQIVLSAGLASLFAIFTPNAQGAVTFLGVAAGDATSTSAILWTRAVDGAAPANTPLMLDITTDSAFASGITHHPGACTTDSTKDYVCKLQVTGLAPNTVYFYRFVGPASELSNIGRVKTAPDSTVSAPVHFAFSGDNDGLMRPYALASVIPAQNLDFYVNLGDVIYETASNVAGSAKDPNNASNPAPWLNSAAVTVSGAIPAPSATGATQTQLFDNYSKKYRENFLPVNTSGQNSLQVLYAAQGNYTTWDNHELGNRQYINGGAPAGGTVGGMPTGAGVDARVAANDVNTSGTFMNQSTGFRTLQQVFLNYQPIADRGSVNASTDPRTDGTQQLYSANQWGKNAIYIDTDSRSYRDIRIKTAANADDTTAPRANNALRTYLGATQLAWLKQALLDAQNAGTRWKFVSISDPIDQIGPIGGPLTLNNLPSFGTGSTYAPVNADGGKSYMGGYRAERNALLKFIADNHITNVIFMATDDHQNRINELTYSPTDTENQSTYVKVPYAFSIVAGPLGATGPDLITNHTFAMAQQYANSLVAAQQAAGVEPFGLIGYPGLHNLVRDGDPTAGTAPQAVDFYSPDTFNFTVLDVNADGKELTVSSVGMDATTQNAAIAYASGPQARTIFSFGLDAAPTVFSVQINDGSAQRSRVRNVTVTLDGVVLQTDIAAGAFILTRAEGGSFTATVQSVSAVSRQTLVTLGFTGPGVGTDGSLPDGSYSLSVDRSKIALDTPTPVTEIATFQTKFGDLNGDGRIDGLEVDASAHAVGAKLGDTGYIWYLDFDGNGKIDGKDQREVARRNSDL